MLSTRAIDNKPSVLVMNWFIYFHGSLLEVATENLETSISLRTRKYVVLFQHGFHNSTTVIRLYIYHAHRNMDNALSVEEWYLIRRDNLLELRKPTGNGVIMKVEDKLSDR